MDKKSRKSILMSDSAVFDSIEQQDLPEKIPSSFFSFIVWEPKSNPILNKSHLKT